ncbi:MAG: ATP-binding cassette domain-containing protein, partial [Alphaproteobacteria bacterium]|nr:ATP-binding cassette domain-containing protein [Alphaproteobacteria bacterium]
YPKPTDATFCLAGLLTALGWRGDPRRLSEVLPHLKETLRAEDIRQVMANLNFSSRHLRIDLADIDPRLMPCLFVPDQGPMLVVLQREDDRITAFDGAAVGLTERQPTPQPGSAYFFQPLDDSHGAAEGSWSRRMLKRFLPHMWLGFGASVFINILALAAPLFVMACYDFVIPAGNAAVLPYLLAGAAIALGAEATFRGFRGHILSFVGARGTYVAGNAVFQRILALPVSFTERATVGSQVARIKDLEGLRDMFVGPLATLFFDLPTSLVFVVALAIINPWLLLVVLFAGVALTLLTTLFYPALKERLSASSRAGSHRQEFLIDSLAKMRAIRLAAAEETWLERHRQISARAIMADFRASLSGMAMSMAAQTLIVLTGLATVSVCVFGALSGAISTGGIIASMMIIWRLLAPLQNAFTAVGTLVRAKASLGQMDALMRLKAESEPTAQVHATRTYRGQIAFNRVSFRYSHEADPALVGVSFQVEPGQVLAVAGSNGSGKSTTIKLMLGLYHAQAGSVRLDGVDLRQIDPVDLRRAISYVPQRPDFFYGTIAQNLRLAHPNATDAELEWALEMSGARDEVLALPRGLDTRILDGHADHMAIGLRQRLSLARAYLKPASLLLLDEPGNGLDFVGDRAFIEAIGRIRGRTAVVIVTHRPSHLRLADAVLYLQGGYGRAFGSYDTVAKQIGLDSL